MISFVQSTGDSALLHTRTQELTLLQAHKLDMSVQLEAVAKLLLMHFVPGTRVLCHISWGWRTAGCIGYMRQVAWVALRLDWAGSTTVLDARHASRLFPQ